MRKPLRPGDSTAIGGYRLIARLGEGGMGTVFLGESRDGRLVAIKTVRLDYAYDSEFRGRFRSEVTRARQVPPFSTAEVLDADPDHDPPYLVVEYVDGPSLDAVVREGGPLSGAALHGLAIGIATALTAIHGAGVIHRDLKPANVLLAPGGIKVIDFGIARAFEATSRHTRTDQMIGTVHYMAPERFDPAPGRPTTAAADVFAWGAVVAYAATGRHPFEADSAPATAMRILTQPPELAGLPDSLRGPVARALAKEPEDRPTARELLDVLVTAQMPRPDRSAARRGTLPAPGGGRTYLVPPGPGLPAEPTGPVNARRGGRTGTAGARRRSRTGPIAVAAVAAAVLIGVAFLVVRDPLGLGTPVAGLPAASASAVPRSGTPAPADTHAAILRGSRQTLLHIVEINRDLALDEYESEVVVGDGKGAKSLFRLVPYGVDYLIGSLRTGTGTEQDCLGVKVDPDGDSTLAPAECVPTQATIFTLIPTGKKDSKNRPTYSLSNETYGFVQYSESSQNVIVEEIGDGEPLSSFSLIDRGPP